MPPSIRKLITIECEDGGARYLRSILLDQDAELPTLADLEYYYHTILGLGYKISMHTLDVPISFSLSLVGGGVNEIPKHFPSHDIQVNDDAARERYFTLLNRVCEMEKMRAEVGFGGTFAATTTTTTTTSQKTPMSEYSTRRMTRYQTWVDEILQNLQASSAFAAAEMTPQAAIADDKTIAWILTPVLEEARDTRGNRIIVAADVGCTWSPRLGTDLYPDIAISRRLSTVNWRVNNSRSAALARTAIEWYVEAQTNEPMPVNGMSPWIKRAEEELASVLVPFQNLGPLQSFHFATGGERDGEGRRGTPLTAIIQRMEEDYIVCARTFTGDDKQRQQLLRPTRVQWERFLRFVYRGYSIPSDVIDFNWSQTVEVISMWMRGDQAIDLTRRPLFDRWSELWSVLFWPQTSSVFSVDLYDEKTAAAVNYSERFDMFLMALDTHDPIASIGMTSTQKHEIAGAWVRLFVEREMVADGTQRVVATHLYDVLRTWALKFLSLQTMDMAMKAMTMGPVLTTMGYLCQKTKKGRAIMGLRYARPDKHLPSALLPPNYMRDVPTTGPTVLEIMAQPSIAPRNVFSVTASNEIHMGKF